MAKVISLKPDHKLMNPDFDGYKLSSDADITLYSKPVTEGVEIRPVGPTCYLGTRLEALHNHLFPDPFNLASVYYFTTRGHLLKSSYSEDCRLSVGEVVWQADLTDTGRQDEDGGEGEGCSGGVKQYHASVTFPTADMAVASNGRGTLHILFTGDRIPTNNQSWLVKFEVDTARGVLAQSLMNKSGSSTHTTVECLLLSVSTPAAINDNTDYVVTDDQLAGSKASSLHLLHWLTLQDNGETWSVVRTRVVAGEGALLYYSLDHSASGLILLAHKNYSFLADSAQPVVKPEKKEKQNEKNGDGPKFIYLQNDEDVTVWVSVGEAVKGDVRVKVTKEELEVKLRDTELLQGRFSYPVQSDITTWSIGEGRLEVVLNKGVEGEHWERVFDGVDAAVGEEVEEPGSELFSRLAHLTSDKWNPDPTPEVPAYDPGQLEACDQAGEELTLIHLCSDTHAPAATAHLGPTQHLFNAQIEAGGPTAFCVRHDVDAVLWQPEGDHEYVHCATYDAFGYVKASKTSAKFTCAASDLTYVAVGDAKSHIYVFYQHGVVDGGELRNRVSGRRVGKVARQLVISLRTHDLILGLHAAPGLLYVLTEKTLYLYCLPTL